ncbi:hypothetical protein QFZ24_000064 [Streptomyces phaeochromogenes]|nr:hypothetical protein [Streptomyces phaeochromogenes]
MVVGIVVIGGLLVCACSVYLMRRWQKSRS